MNTFADPSFRGSRHRAFRVRLTGVDLKFAERELDDPLPTGRQIVETFSPGDPADFLLLHWLPSGMLEEVRPDETVDLRARGDERFIIARSDRSYRFEVEGRRQEWPVEVITAGTVKALSEIDAMAFDVVLMRQDEPDRVLDDNDVVNLDADGLERFRLRPRPREVTIQVNGGPVLIATGSHSGAEIKRMAIQQGVRIELDFLLSVEQGDGTTKIIGNADVVEVREGLRFTAIADDDNS